MIQGLSHITIMVTDLRRTAELLCRGLGATEVFDSNGRNYSHSREKYFMLGNIWLVAMTGHPAERSYRHIAFQVNESDLEQLARKVGELGAELVPSRPRISEEGNSIYFHDYDNNLFELHAGSLDSRLQAYRRTAAERDRPAPVEPEIHQEQPDE